LRVAQFVIRRQAVHRQRVRHNCVLHCGWRRGSRRARARSKSPSSDNSCCLHAPCA
jgi:hypothetical protein